MVPKAQSVWRYYALMLAAGLSIIWLLLLFAPDGDLGRLPGNVAPSVLGDIAARLRDPLVMLLLQILTIVTLARLAGNLALRLGQPSVFGEILAGIVLGPSVFGWLAPAAQQWLFPAQTMGGLKLLSQLGIVIFLFGIGAELNLGDLRRRSMQVLLVSHTSIILPFAFGIGCALWLFADYAPPRASFISFSLFMGVAMSITAFPVLVRILRERRMVGTPTGDMATVCAAIDDVTAWCLLVGVIAIGNSAGAMSALSSVGMTIAWSALLLMIVRPRLNRLQLEQRQTGGVIVALLLFALSSATVTELIGVHALFGAFVAGATVANHPGLRRIVLEKIEPLPLALLLPLFFAFTGLRTKIGLLDGTDWLVCAGIILAATAGKFGGASLAVRVTGGSWRDACVLGLLMNTRGLMELVVLNIGYDLGFLSDRVFVMMVLMTLVTTFATGPLLARLKWASDAPPASASKVQTSDPAG